MSTPIKAGPTKAFFVKMLTRDIELADAILDLLDNCIDGVVRQLKDVKPEDLKERPYEGYWAKITAKPGKFEIWDNCGGIPRDVAVNSAFMLGRLDAARDSDVETVGMYGIGMKRAIFKMGRRARVVSQPDTGPYEVNIPPEWLDDEPTSHAGADAGTSDPWTLALNDIGNGLSEDGTKITVTDLYEPIATQFDQKKSAFLADLEKEIARHYAVIIDKGFTVKLNNEDVVPVSLTLLSPSEPGATDGPAIEPYVFAGNFDGVSVELAVGFYRPLATETELENEELVASSRENAGWTVICNDRVVLFNDKTAKTGWGTKGVTPGYHNQFISIAGVVFFRSTDSMKLPLNTTKRGLDTSSEIYHIVLNYMRDGLKKFTSFTNSWKRRESETQTAFEKLHSRKMSEIARTVVKSKLVKDRKQQDAQYYAPDLPKPENRTKTVRVCFGADREDVALVASYYFDDADQDRADVGKRCFDESLKRAKKA